MGGHQNVRLLRGADGLLVFLQIIFLVSVCSFRSTYLIGCGGLLLWLGGFRLLVKKRSGPWCSVLLLLPAIGLCVLSAAPLFADLLPVYDTIQTGIICILIGTQAFFVTASLIVRRNEKDVSIWLIRQFDFALLCTLLPSLVSQLLLLGEESEWRRWYV